MRATPAVSRVLLASVFAGAGVLKFVAAIQNGPPALRLFRGSRLELPASVGFAIALAELSLAVALFANRRWAPHVAFGVAASFVLGLVGAEMAYPGIAKTCGCFGNVDLDLWHHLAISGVVVLLANLTTPNAAQGVAN